MKYSTRPNNARDRSQQVNRSPHFNFQKQHRPQATGHEYILTISDTQAVSISVVQPTQIAITQPATVIDKVQQPSRPSSASAQPTSYVVVDDQQPGTSRQMIFNPPSVAASQQEKSQHNTSRLSSLFGAVPSLLQYQQVDTPQPFSPSQLQPAPITSAIFHSSRKVKTSQPVQPAESAQISRLACTSHTKPALLRANQIFQKQLFS